MMTAFFLFTSLSLLLKRITHRLIMRDESLLSKYLHDMCKHLFNSWIISNEKDVFGGRLMGRSFVELDT